MKNRLSIFIFLSSLLAQLELSAKTSPLIMRSTNHQMICANQNVAFVSSLLPSSLRNSLSGANDDYLVAYKRLLDMQSLQQISQLQGRLDSVQSPHSLDQKKMERILSSVRRISARRDLNNSSDKLNRRILSLTQRIRSGEDYAECGLTDEEIFAIHLYTTTLYRQINSILRSNQSEQIQRIQPFIAAIDSGLDKLAPYHGPVLRGTDLPVAVRSSYCQGCTVSDRAFTSTSITTQYPGKHWLNIQSASGRYIAPLSSSPSMQEVLFKPGTKFQVKRISNGRDQRGKPIEKFELAEIP